MKHRVLLIGLGQIGLGYDLALEPAAFVLTHARAFATHPDFELVAGVDPEPGRGELFFQHYGCPAFTDLPTALAETKPDVVVVASPTPQHGATVQQVLRLATPRLILCEKPLSFDLDEARAMVSACEERDCLLYVNYMRRAAPGAVDVARRLSDGAMGTPVKGVAWYSKGLFNNGSHFLNLLELWLGAMVGFEVIEAGRLWEGVDPEPDLHLRFARGAVTVLAAREECFSHGEIELIAPNGRLRYEQGGAAISWQPVVSDPLVAGYSVLSPMAETIESGAMRSQWHVVNQLAARLQGEPAHVCSGAEALVTLESMAAIRDKLWA